jgi:CRP-like cAMP-binding protein
MCDAAYPGFCQELLKLAAHERTTRAAPIPRSMVPSLVMLKMISLILRDPAPPADAHDRLIRALRTIGELSAADEEAIRALPGRIRRLEAYEDIVAEGDRPNAISVIIEGFACRYKMLEDGRRQIVSFHIAGDAPDAQSLLVDRMDHSLGTLDDTTVLHISHEAMFELFEANPHIALLFWRWTLIEASIFREWVMNVGRREAYEGVAHLLCEIMSRMKAVGLSDGRTCQLPITQAELGDATGLSTVHVNRTLQSLRANKLIHLKTEALTILDWEGLKKAGQFEQGYLHLRQDVA